MRKLLSLGLVLALASVAHAQTACYSWQFAGGGSSAVLNGPGDSAVIEVYVTIDVDFAGWHYDTNASYNPPGTPNFVMTALAVHPDGDRYDGLIPPGGDMDLYRSFADILEQAPGVFWLPAGTYLIEELTVNGTGTPSDGTISFDPNPGTGYNILWKNPADGIEQVPGVCTPDPLTITPEPASLALLLAAGIAVLARRRAA